MNTRTELEEVIEKSYKIKLEECSYGQMLLILNQLSSKSVETVYPLSIDEWYKEVTGNDYMFNQDHSDIFDERVHTLKIKDFEIENDYNENYIFVTYLDNSPIMFSHIIHNFEGDTIHELNSKALSKEHYSRFTKMLFRMYVEELLADIEVYEIPTFTTEDNKLLDWITSVQI